MPQGKNKIIENILSIISTCFFTLIGFIMLGTFYKAIEHTIGLNIIVWLLTIHVAYYLYYILHWIISCFKKNLSKPKIYNSWAIFAGMIMILFICFLLSYGTNDYLYVEVMLALASIWGFVQLCVTFLKKRK